MDIYPGIRHGIKWMTEILQSLWKVNNKHMGRLSKSKISNYLNCYGCECLTPLPNISVIRGGKLKVEETRVHRETQRPIASR